jgi:excisionase family DNA binding protein
VNPVGWRAATVEQERLLTPSEVAERFKVHPLAVTRWAVHGRIGVVRTLGGHTTYKEAEVRRLLREGTCEVPQRRRSS